MLKRIYLLFSVFMTLSVVMQAQVTTSSIGGIIKSADGKPLVGATITAKHEPTGTVYTSVSRSNGVYDIQNMRPGGPYTIVATYVGHNPVSKSDVTLALGEDLPVDFQLSASGGEMQEVIVTTSNRPTKSGAATNITNRQITTLPTISRSINDFTRLTPQAGNGNGFNGRESCRR